MSGTDLCACGHKRQSHRLAERECFYSSCLCTKFDVANAEFPLPAYFRDFDKKVAYDEDEGRWVWTGERGSVMDCRQCRGNIDRCDCGKHETIAT